MKSIEKIFNPWVLLALNVIIIFSAELFGNGKLFFDTGLIHAIAIAFIILSVSRIYAHYHTFDAFLERLVHAALIAMTIFAFSHLAEFLSYMVFHLKEDAIFANVANFYIVSMLFMALGAEYFIGKHDHKNRMSMYAIAVLIFLFIALIPLFILQDGLPSLDTDEPMFFIYLAAIAASTIFTMVKLVKIKHLVSMTREFVNYLLATAALVGFSALQNISYEFLEKLGMPDYQIIYTSHFAFYGALSLMFLAFVRLANLPGIYGAIEEERKSFESIPKKTAKKSAKKSALQ